MTRAPSSHRRRGKPSRSQCLHTRHGRAKASCRHMQRAARLAGDNGPPPLTDVQRRCYAGCVAALCLLAESKQGLGHHSRPRPTRPARNGPCLQLCKQCKQQAAAACELSQRCAARCASPHIGFLAQLHTARAGRRPRKALCCVWRASRAIWQSPSNNAGTS